jgi:hypothetical protein
MPDAVDDVIGCKKLAHRGMGSLEFGDQLPGLYFIDQVFQGTLEDDEILIRPGGFILRRLLSDLKGKFTA